MKFPVCTLAIVFILQCCASFAQYTRWELLRFKNIEFRMGINITTRDGDLAMPDSINGCWRKSLVNRNDSDSILANIRLDQVCFFNADTGIVSGYGFMKHKQSTYKYIYRTADAGKSWKQIHFGMNDWVYDISYLNNGEAWLRVMGHGSNGITYSGAYTKNYGFTWTEFPFPSIKGQWFKKIFFNAAHEGIIGSQYNGLAYTRDNGKTWIIMPTPRDQKKYKKRSKRHKSAVNEVAIFNDYLLVNQEGHIFYSKKDKVDWVLMPGYTDFYTDAANSALFFKNTNGAFVKSNPQLQPVASFESIDKAYKVLCRDGSLYMISDNQVGQINTSNKLVVFPLCTDSPF